MCTSVFTECTADLLVIYKVIYQTTDFQHNTPWNDMIDMAAHTTSKNLIRNQKALTIGILQFCHTNPFVRQILTLHLNLNAVIMKTVAGML